MNRQQKRQRARALNQHAQAMVKEGQGLFDFEIIQPHHRVTVARAAALGDPKWRNVIELFADMMHRPSPAATCLLCPAELDIADPGLSFVVVSPGCDEPTHRLLHGLCGACCARHAGELGAAVVAHYEQHFFGGEARRIWIHPEAGHG